MLICKPSFPILGVGTAEHVDDSVLGCHQALSLPSVPRKLNAHVGVLQDVKVRNQLHGQLIRHRRKDLLHFDHHRHLQRELILETHNAFLHDGLQGQLFQFELNLVRFHLLQDLGTHFMAEVWTATTQFQLHLLAVLWEERALAILPFKLVVGLIQTAHWDDP